MIAKILLVLSAIFAIAMAFGHGHGGQSKSFRKQDDHGNYAFAYDIADPHGAKNSRQEAGDKYGNKHGSYALHDSDGRVRIVDYVADKKGFRAKIRSNEPGVGKLSAADAFYYGPGGGQGWGHHRG